MVVASASVRLEVQVGVLLPKKNRMTDEEIVELRADYSIPPSVGLRLSTATAVVKYSANGCVLIFTNMYKHGLRLPLHPWVQMMLSKLGYAPRQYNTNFWILFHGFYISW